MEAKVSAYVPAFNCEETIARTLQGLLSQTIKPDDIFVVDDGSTDRTSEIAKSLGIRVVRHESNLGRGAARKRAFLEAKNDFILGCDASIVAERNFIERALQGFSADDVAAVYGRIYLEQPERSVDRWVKEVLYNETRYEHFKHGADLITTCMLGRKSHFLTAGNFDENFKGWEDAEMSERLRRSGFDVIYDPTLIGCDVRYYTVSHAMERYCRWHYRVKTSTTNGMDGGVYSLHLKQIAKYVLFAMLFLGLPFYFAYWIVFKNPQSQPKL